MRPIIYPYKSGSTSARLLSEELRLRGHRAKRVRPDGNYRYWSNHLAISWGNSRNPEWPSVRNAERIWLNRPESVYTASNKLRSFIAMREAGVSIPEFTTNASEVHDSLGTSYGLEWLARTKLSGHSGEGIVPIMGGQEYGPEGEVWPRAGLYVKYIKKMHEYRVHVFRGEVIDIQQKRKRREVPNEEVDYQIRNHRNGWIYARNDISTPNDLVLTEAAKAVSSLRLDFGGVDVIWNEHSQQAYVLEVNTAPGLEGSTLTNYTNAIEALL